jgi:hypothetical protein
VLIPQAELDLVTSKRRTAMWFPAGRGTLGQLSPCTVELGQVIGFQVRAFTKSTRVTVAEKPFLTALGTMSATQARQQGYDTVQAAREAWRRSYGQDRNDTLTWVFAFVLGDRSAFFAEHAERYLKAKMGGGRSYTTDPDRAVHGEGAVPDADLAGMAHLAGVCQEEEEQATLRETLRTIGKEIAKHDGKPLPKEVAKEVAWLRRRAARLEELVRT